MADLASPLDHFVMLRTGEKAAKEQFNIKPPVAMVPPREYSFYYPSIWLLLKHGTGGMEWNGMGNGMELRI